MITERERKKREITTLRIRIYDGINNMGMLYFNISIN